MKELIFYNLIVDLLFHHWTFVVFKFFFIKKKSIILAD